MKEKFLERISREVRKKGFDPVDPDTDADYVYADSPDLGTEEDMIDWLETYKGWSRKKAEKAYEKMDKDGIYPTEGPLWEEAVSNYVDNAFEEFFADFDETATTAGNKLEIYRCITLEDPAEFLNSLKKGVQYKDFKGTGVFWSWDKEAAECHWGGKGDTYILTALVPMTGIDMPETARRNLCTSLKEEKEILIKTEAPLLVTKLEDEDGKVLFEGKKRTHAAQELKLRKELKAMGVPVYASKKTGNRYIRKSDAGKVLAHHRLAGYDKSVMPVRIQDPSKANKVLAELGVNPAGGFVRTSDVERIMRRVHAELVGDQIIWYDKSTGEIIAAFDIWQKLKSASKTLLKKGALVLIGIAVLAGSASGKDLKKSDDLKGKYAKSIEMVGEDLGLDLDVEIDTKKSGGLSKTLLKITNEDTGNSIQFEITTTDSGTFSDVEMKKQTKEKNGELDYDFEGLGTEMYESLQKQIMEKGLHK